MKLSGKVLQDTLIPYAVRLVQTSRERISVLPRA